MDGWFVWKNGRFLRTNLEVAVSRTCYTGVYMTTYITSAQNPLIKHVRQLAESAKYRQKHQQTVLDGVHLCDAYLRSGAVPLQVIVGVESLKNPEVSEILFRLDESVAVTEVPSSLHERISVLEQGVALLFVIGLPEKRVASEIIDGSVLLERVQDPGNLGAILRTAAAAGVGAVYVSEGSSSVWSPRVLRAGMGAHFGLDVYEGADLKYLVSSTELPVLATSLSAERSIYDVDLKAPHAWLFGNEGAGVSAELMDACRDDTVIIPQASSVESLNVAAAAAVCLFEAVRQRKV